MVLIYPLLLFVLYYYIIQMADNIHVYKDDEQKRDRRLQEIKAMEDAEQRLIEDLFSIPDKVKAPVKISKK